MDKVFLARTATGTDIYIGQATYDHMQAHANISFDDVKEAIEKSSYEGPFGIGSTDLGRIVGKDNCVEVTPEDKVEPMYRIRRNGPTPFADKEPADTSKVTVGMCLDDDGKHTMFTAFYGQLAEKEPWDPSLKPGEKEKSERFWATHALAKDSAGNWKKSIDWERTNQEREKMEKMQKKIEPTEERFSSLQEILANARKVAGIPEQGKAEDMEPGSRSDGVRTTGMEDGPG